MNTPASMHYFMPAEWAPHQATWLTWRRREGISFPGRYDTIPPALAAFVRELAAVEEVHINVGSRDMESGVRDLLIKQSTPLDRVNFHRFPSYEPWCRDHGPTFLVRERDGRRERAIVDWGYNAWGNKYPPFDLDDAIPQRVAEFRELPVFSPRMILEGGAIDVNGHGAVLTTRSCLLNPNRNPDLNQAEVEQLLKDYLGVTQVLWVEGGLAGDDTDGHIDNLARFVNPTTIAAPVEEDPRDENYTPMLDLWRQLELLQDPVGRPFRLLRMPTPRPVFCQGQRMPASYMNFYIANDLVVVPAYQQPSDEIACRVLQQVFPDRRVTGLDSTDLIWGLGSFHCLSQQEPA